MERKERDAAPEKENEQFDTLDLMFTTLSNLGCQPAKQEDGTLEVQYQGETFCVESNGIFARVWDPMWAHIKADDPRLPNIREAVNLTNFNFGPTVMLTNTKEDGVLGFCSRCDFMLHPACPDNEGLVKTMLDFFCAKDSLRLNFEKITAAQAQKPRRPVGFATGVSNEA